MAQPAYPVADRSYSITPHIYAQSGQEQASVFADEQMILANKLAAENILGKPSVAPEAKPLSNHKVGYGVNQTPPTNINLVWYTPRPTFWELLWGQRQYVTNINNIYAAPAQAPRNREEVAAAKEDRKERQEEKNAQVAFWVGITALFSLAVAFGYELVKWKEARENAATVGGWQQKTVGDNVQLGGFHPHAQKLQAFATGASTLANMDKSSRNWRLSLTIAGLASAALLTVGGYLSKARVYKSGWFLGGATVFVILVRFGMSLAASKDKRKEVAQFVLKEGNELLAIQPGQRQLYFWKQGAQLPVWQEERQVQLDQYYENAYRASQENKNIYPYNPASPYGSLLNSQFASPQSEHVDGEVPPPSHL